MLKISAITILTACLFVSSCKPEPILEAVTQKSITINDLLGEVNSRSTNSTSEYSNIYLVNSEYIDTEKSKVFSTYSGWFRETLEPINSYVGSLSIGGEQLINFSENNKYLLDRGICSFSELGSLSNVKLVSSNGNFASFIHNVYKSRALRVKSNVGLGEYFDSSKDLILRWDQDSEFPNNETYIAICCQGSPVVIEKVIKGNEARIVADKFSSFPKGKRVYMLVGRGYESYLEQNNGKNVSIFSIAYAKSIGYTVK